MKTGGLADVSGSLPHALKKAGHDVRIVLPAYREVMDKLKHPPRTCVETSIAGYPVSLKETRLPGTRLSVWLIDAPELFDRPGNPYLDDTGKPWPDNAVRFMVFCRMICLVALNQCNLNWKPTVVHCNDWQTGLVPALLDREKNRPATVFTIHNLAYQGVFDRITFEQLELPEDLWHYEKLEFHDQFSFIKGGLVFSDRINTVSPHYSNEIQTSQFGHGLHDLLQHRSDRLCGIINGIDTKHWNPGTDPLIAEKYNRKKLSGKTINKTELQSRFSLPEDESALLMGLVSRLVEQKGIDMIISILPELAKRHIQLVILGSGDKDYETALTDSVSLFPEHVSVHIGYDETLAHQIEAGADLFLMPSRFEPCGLNQMYSQRYGTLPLVTPVGGLCDTVIGANRETIKNGTATGFMLDEVSEKSLLQTIDRALDCFEEKNSWESMVKTAMQQDFSWEKSAALYADLYRQAIRDNHETMFI